MLLTRALIVCAAVALILCARITDTTPVHDVGAGDPPVAATGMVRS